MGEGQESVGKGLTTEAFREGSAPQVSGYYLPGNHFVL